MKLYTKCALLAALVAGSFGCATNSYKKLPDVPVEQKAVVLGNPSNLKLVGVDQRIQFRELDGEQLYRGSGQGYPTKIDLMPGQHRFVIGFSVYDNSSFQESGEVAFDANVQAGRSYRVELKDEGAEGWKAALVERGPQPEMTGKAKPASSKR